MRVIFDFIRTHKKYTSENRNEIMNSRNVEPTIEKSDYSFELNGKNPNSYSDNDLKGKNYIIFFYGITTTISDDLIV